MICWNKAPVVNTGYRSLGVDGKNTSWMELPSSIIGKKTRRRIRSLSVFKMGIEIKREFPFKLYLRNVNQPGIWGLINFHFPNQIYTILQAAVLNTLHHKSCFQAGHLSWQNWYLSQDDNDRPGQAGLVITLERGWRRMLSLSRCLISHIKWFSSDLDDQSAIALPGSSSWVLDISKFLSERYISIITLIH